MTLDFGHRRPLASKGEVTSNILGPRGFFLRTARVFGQIRLLACGRRELLAAR